MGAVEVGRPCSINSMGSHLGGHCGTHMVPDGRLGTHQRLGGQSVVGNG
jgi:hypothetical protein